jgi:prevent-host-death family protein
MNSTVSVHEAKSQLSRLLVEVQNGHDIVIANRGVPVARLVQYVEPTRPPWGSLTLGREIPDDVFAPLTDEELSGWNL